MKPLSVLIVTAAPDDRASTLTLHDVISELRTRSDVRVDVWFLRESGGQRWNDTRVVDDLRTEEPAWTFDRFGLTPLANAVRGRALRRWFRDIDPDVVLLDDGLGRRLLGSAKRPVRTIVRLNPVPPADAGSEPPPAKTADLSLVTPGADQSVLQTPRSLQMPLVRAHPGVLPLLDTGRRAAVRRRLDLPTDVSLVVGWGDDAWLDGPDLLVRALWILERKHGVVAHGLWLVADEEAGSQIDAEAGRCRLADRVHRRSASTTDARVCGDAVFLPYRSAGSVDPLREALVAGLEVVSFPVWEVADPSLRLVPHLDVDTAAAALVDALRANRTACSASAVERHDVRPWVERFVDVLQEMH